MSTVDSANLSSLLIVLGATVFFVATVTVLCLLPLPIVVHKNKKCCDDHGASGMSDDTWSDEIVRLTAASLADVTARFPQREVVGTIHENGEKHALVRVPRDSTDGADVIRAASTAATSTHALAERAE